MAAQRPRPVVGSGSRPGPAAGPQPSSYPRTTPLRASDGAHSMSACSQTEDGPEAEVRHTAHREGEALVPVDAQGYAGKVRARESGAVLCGQGDIGQGRAGGAREAGPCAAPRVHKRGLGLSSLKRAFWSEARESAGPRLDLRQILPAAAGNFQSCYTLGEELRTSGMAVLWHCVEKRSGERHMCKTTMKRDICSTRQVLDIVQEVESLQRLGGLPNIVDLKGVFEDKDAVHMVMEPCEGGTLADAIRAAAPAGGLSEAQAADYFRELVHAVGYAHRKGICHRRLQPDAVFLKPCWNGTETQLKLADFEASVSLIRGHKTAGVLGESQYTAPEGRSAESLHGHEADIWSLGVILCELLTGQPPHIVLSGRDHGNTPGDGAIQLPLGEGGHPISSGAEKLLRRVLRQDPDRRATVEEILADRWLRHRAPAGTGRPPRIDRRAGILSVFPLSIALAVARQSAVVTPVAT